jgi:hypothetical protein
LGIGDKWRSLFSKKKSPELRQLHDWVAEHPGVEGYIEPRTTTNPTSLLLVDRDGDHARAPLRDPDQGRKFCERHGIPVYDAQVIGYPKRMRDFERRRGRRERTSTRRSPISSDVSGRPPKKKVPTARTTAWAAWGEARETSRRPECAIRGDRACIVWAVSAGETQNEFCASARPHGGTQG